MKNLFFIFIIALLFSGCGSTKNIEIAKINLAHINGKTIVVTLSQEPDFIAKTTDSVILGKMAEKTMIIEGNNIIKDNNIQDPVHYIKKNIIKKISKKISFTTLLNDDIEPSDDFATLINKYSDKDYILNIKTTNWKLTYFIWDWNVYKVIYDVRLRFINTKDGSLVESTCSNVPKNIKTAPPYNKYLKNDAQMLKDELQLAADKCLDEFSKNILAL